MANVTYRFFTDSIGGRNPGTFIGNKGDITFNVDTMTLQYHDGVNPGGITISGGGSSGSTDLSNYYTKSEVDGLVFSGDYTDLSNTPIIPSLGNFTITNNNIVSDNGASPIKLSIFGPTSDDPPALIFKEWSFNTDGSMTFPDGTVQSTAAINQTLSYNPSTYQLSISNGNSVDLTTLAGGGSTSNADAAVAEHIAQYHSADTPATSADPAYRGYSAYINQISGDDPSINQLIIYKYDSNTSVINVDSDPTDTDVDSFRMADLSSSGTIVAVAMYGNNSSSALTSDTMKSFFTSFVDNVMYNGNTEITTAEQFKTNFYANRSTIASGFVAPNDLTSSFRFYDTVPTTIFNINPLVQTGGVTYSGNISVSIKYEGNTYATDGYGYGPGQPNEGSEFTIPGSSLGGTSPENDCVLVFTNGSLVVQSGLSVGQHVWPSNSIQDGGSDQYDTGNRIITSLNTSGIAYANGDVVTASSDFGGGDYVAVYESSIFAMCAINANVYSFGFDGSTGSDGDGQKVSYPAIDSGAFEKVATKLANGSWEIVNENNNIVFKYNGTPKVYFRSDGTIDAVGDVNSYI